MPTRNPDSAPAPSAAPPSAARGAREGPRLPRAPRWRRRSLGDHNGRPTRPPSRFDGAAETTRSSRKELSRRHRRGSCAGRSPRRSRSRGPPRATSLRRSLPAATRRRASTSASSWRAARSPSRRLSPPAHAGSRQRATASAARIRPTVAAMLSLCIDASRSDARPHDHPPSAALKILSENGRSLDLDVVIDKFQERPSCTCANVKLLVVDGLGRRTHQLRYSSSRPA